MKTPEEIFTRKTPDISNLRIFGTKVFVSIPKHRRTKMEAKASTCILLGIDDLTKGYRCYCPRTKRILISRDIIVEESRSESYIIGEENSKTFPFQLFHMNMPQHHPGTPVTPTTTPPMVMEQEFPDTAQEPARNPSSPDPQEPGLSDISREALSPAPVPTLPNSHVVYTRKPRLEQHTAPIRRSTRPKRPSVRLEGYVGSLEPSTLSFTTASNNPRWLAAMQEELDSLQENNTWTLTPLPRGKQAITSKWVYTIKPGRDGIGDRYKARLVARGFQQRLGMDYYETFASVAKYNTIKAVTALIGTFGWQTHHMDIKTAYLNSKLSKQVYMQQPTGYTQPRQEHLVSKLGRSLYGLKQSDRNWNRKITHWLQRHGLSPTSADPNLFFHHQSKLIVILILYVDDLFITGSDTLRI
jgi:hypothetical protein